MSIHVRIYDNDTVRDIAAKIFEEFDVMASCKICGFVMDERKKALVPKGELVWEVLKQLDEKENTRAYGSKRQRVWTYRKDSVGGPITQKIFTYQVHVVDSEPRWTIWRYQ